MCVSKDSGAIKTKQVFRTLPQSTLVMSEITAGDPGTGDPVVWYVLKMTEEEFKRLLDSAPFVARGLVIAES